MQFLLVDRITKLVPGEEIVASKALSMAEEYLADHFPSFPVMPGVLMIEAMTQASSWLVHVTDDFAHSMVGLQSVKNVKYGRFVEPGETLHVTAKIVEREGNLVRLKTQGTVDGETSVRANLTLECYNLAERNPGFATTDERVIVELRRQFALLDRTANSATT